MKATSPPIILEPMTQDEFHAWLAQQIEQYARDKIQSGDWPEPGSLERSRGSYDKLLPQGPKTKDHHLFSIKDSSIGKGVGALWLAILDQGTRKIGFVYDLIIWEEFRRRGYATAAMLALERIATDLGLESLSLHVFGHNLPAIKLYEKLGYTVTDLNMMKKP